MRPTRCSVEKGLSLRDRARRGLEELARARAAQRDDDERARDRTEDEPSGRKPSPHCLDRGRDLGILIWRQSFALMEERALVLPISLGAAHIPDDEIGRPD